MLAQRTTSNHEQAWTCKSKTRPPGGKSKDDSGRRATTGRHDDKRDRTKWESAGEPRQRDRLKASISSSGQRSGTTTWSTVRLDRTIRTGTSKEDPSRTVTASAMLAVSAAAPPYG